MTAANEPLPDVTLEGTLLGDGLPTAAGEHLRLAGQSYQQDDVALDHLRLAQALAPNHIAVLIGLYRFFFYKGKLSEALEVAVSCLAKVARESNLPADWRLLSKEDTPFVNFDDAVPRFYLFTLKAYAYLKLRLGDFAEGRQAIDKLLDIDPTDKVGARLLLDVLERIKQCDEDYAGGQ